MPGLYTDKPAEKTQKAERRSFILSTGDKGTTDYRGQKPELFPLARCVLLRTLSPPVARGKLKETLLPGLAIAATALSPAGIQSKELTSGWVDKVY